MVRKLIKPLLSITMMAPAAALALGLGEVKLHSALNQNLNADIELLSVEPGDVEELEVSLASAETFAKLGLNRPAVLMFVQFETKQGKDGKYYVHATSKDAIREPFLDFLVEAKWPAGRVLREYTLLLDPPTRHAEMAAPVNAATTSMGGGQPMASSSAPQQAPMAPSQGAVSAPMPQQESVTYYPQPQQQTAAPGGVSYGPVRAGDTLWQIALKVRPNRDISAPQMMMALLKANPHAFVDNNVNRLKKGFVLRVDDPALYTAMSQAEAARAISQQTREWQDYREAVAAKAGERQSATADTGTSRSTASGKSEPKLTLVAPNGKQKGMGAGGDAADGDMQEQLMLALESSAAQRKDNEELQGRVDDLEAQLQDMQRLLALKDSDMATLQKQLREQGTAVTLPSEQAAQPKPEAAPAAKPEEKPASAAAPVTEEQPKAEAAKPAETAAPATPAMPAQKPKPKPRVMPQPQPEPSFIDMLLGDQLMLMAGGGVIVLLLLLGLVISRRRGKGGFQESILSGGTSSMLNTGSDESRSETSFLSDLAISGMGGGSISADEGEVDPITEADVFMAYGRYQQAEEVLKKALEAHPDRPDVIGKLFEVYFNTREKDKFDELVDTSAAAVQDNDSIWPSVAAMGKQISPENPLFAVAESEAPSAPAVRPEPITEDVLDIGLDLDELSAEMESDADISDSLDLGLDLGDLDSAPATRTASTQEATSSDLDFDLDFGDDGAMATSAASSDMGDLDFDLGELDAGEESSPSPAEAVAESAVLELDSSALNGMQDDGLGGLDLGDLDFGDLGGSTSATEETAEVSLDLSELDSGDDFGELTSDTASSSADDNIFGDGDEISTKLDLAQAYIEMGDGEGARSMLDEVVVQGNAKQKQQAEALLSRI